MGKTSAKVKAKWNAKAYDRLNVFVAKGDKEKIRQAAEAADMSLNAYVKEAINEKIGRLS